MAFDRFIRVRRSPALLRLRDVELVQPDLRCGCANAEPEHDENNREVSHRFYGLDGGDVCGGSGGFMSRCGYCCSDPRSVDRTRGPCGAGMITRADTAGVG